MNYQVWIKNEYDESYEKVDCGDLPAARREIDKAVRAGREPLLTVEVPYELSIKVSEVGSEVTPRKPKPSEGPGPESEGKPGPGAPPAVPEQH